MRVADRFCPNCGVSMDLHPDDDDDESYWACDMAEKKAEFLEQFGGLVR